MTVQLALMVLPAAAAIWFFRLDAVRLLLTCLVAGLLAEILVNVLRMEKPAGSRAHSLLMALLLAFTLPADTPTYVAFIGAAAAVLIGKHAFGGMGHYLWHPALVGRLVVQLLFADQIASAGPPEALRRLADIARAAGANNLNDYLFAHLPPLEQFFYGAVPGGIGETCKIMLVLAGCYLLYRGYTHWQLPLWFLLGAYLTAWLSPFPADAASGPTRWLSPLTSESLLVVFTYANYQLYSGSIFLAALMLFDSTSRPITIPGQVFFGFIAGVLAMILRLYTPIAVPAYTALLVCYTFIPLIDRYTRPRGRRNL